MIRTLIVDDQALVRGGLRAMLEVQEDIEVVGEARDGAQAVEQAALRHPDVMPMDIRMPRMDGIEATRRLKAAPGAPQVLILTTFDVARSPHSPSSPKRPSRPT
jgi:DNA-binding NarL/FixJ family response regulator